jgi:molybdopterin converting factor small subunit
LRTLAGGRGEHDLPGGSVIELLRGFEGSNPRAAGWILDERGLIRRHINVFVNGERGDERTSVPPGARVDVIPAITGG